MLTTGCMPGSQPVTMPMLAWQGCFSSEGQSHTASMQSLALPDSSLLPKALQKVGLARYGMTSKLLPCAPSRCQAKHLNSAQGCTERPGWLCKRRLGCSMTCLTRMCLRVPAGGQSF